jgi:hypothetical protein
MGFCIRGHKSPLTLKATRTGRAGWEAVGGKLLRGIKAVEILARPIQLDSTEDKSG